MFRLTWFALSLAFVLTSSSAPLPIPAAGATAVTYRSDLVLDHHHPLPETGDAPAIVVLVHGCCGDRRDMSGLGRALARRGAVVMNADVRSVAAGGGWPDTYVDVVCAVAAARSLAVSSTQEGAAVVALIGWGDGALVGAAAALGWDSISELARDCVFEVPAAGPDVVIGLGGHFGWTGDIPAELITPRTVDWFGCAPAACPSSWSNGNPGWWLGQADVNRSTSFLLIDGPGRSHTSDFETALASRQIAVEVVLVDGTSHGKLIQPRSNAGYQALQAIATSLQLE